MTLAEFAEVAVPLPVKTTFHYRIPAKLQTQAAPGKRVMVPFGPRHLMGTIVGFADSSPFGKTKTLESILDEEPVLRPDLLELTRWMAQVYQAGWGETIAAALPGPLRRARTPMKPRKQEEPPPATPSQPFKLTAEQQRALEAVLEPVQSKTHEVFLLYGITSSGKTEVYLQAIQHVLDQGRDSIVLVPEISLTPQAIERFQGRFGPEKVAVLHSGMLESRRMQEWNRIRSGEARVVVGARSAVFAPVRSLGLIVVDEEHEPSYKQDDTPRYHAREAAIRRAQISGAAVILGSATPALETYYAATSGTGIHLLRLQERIDEVPLPEVTIVDMREQIASGRRSRIFSRPLEDGLTKALTAQQQGILFLNRRGFATFAHCRKCGHVLRCDSCQISLTYHIATKKMVCHSCHASTPVPDLCPICKGDYVRFEGTGTEKVESELSRLLPQARIDRMDTDATQMRGSHARILQAFSAHELDFLVGTQMIAKGLDFPRVTLVGVISADTALNLPDFRSSERTFALLTQVGGRAGRGKMPGRVIVQTYAPHHYAILAAKTHDYQAFYRQEISIRKQLNLPPFCRLADLTVRCTKEMTAREGTENLAKLAKELLPAGFHVLGPAPAPIPRLRSHYRWHILVKAPGIDAMTQHLPALLKKFRCPRNCRLAVDVDPL
ncbi:MAG: primosomal protein N' [Candidatus Omnitrophota bacterium]|nr:primosomal protein N' [Candidatus Omnitrophota bacterium]